MYNSCVFDTGKVHINGLVQDCSNSIVNALELPQSCAKLLIYGTLKLDQYCCPEGIKLVVNDHQTDPKE